MKKVTKVSRRVSHDEDPPSIRPRVDYREPRVLAEKIPFVPPRVEMDVRFVRSDVVGGSTRRWGKWSENVVSTLSVVNEIS